MEIDHIGYLVKNMEKARRTFENLGYVSEGERVYDKIRDVEILFLENGGYRVELVCPVSEKSVVNDTLKKMGSTPYHICYRCEHIEEEQKRLREEGFIPSGEILPAPAFEGRRVCFLYSRAIGMIELVEKG